MELSDGRKVKATVLGSVKQKVSAVARYASDDVGMILLDEKGDWPTATMLGPATGPELGAFCMALGYPVTYKRGQPPLLRLGRILASNERGKIRIR